MKCLHCSTEIHSSPRSIVIEKDKHGIWLAVHQVCPACDQLLVDLVRGPASNQPGITIGRIDESIHVLPKASSRPSPPQEVPAVIAEDFIEAARILADSPKASAALSRRCLQHILRSCAKVNPQNLAKEIDDVIASGKLPSHLSEAIDAIRNIGNFAAHPTKSTASDSIIPVEPGEAEWTLDVLEGLFDFYFVQPEILRRRRAALDLKLADANRPPMK